MKMSQQQLTIAATRLALRRDPGLTGVGLSEEVESILYEWSCEEELDCEPDDTPSVANCDDWGTGEGRYHGRM
ncbi:hypothetical protein [Ralstonia pickettii]|uniref:hypothetical protein n=1 Tax=Ralstonia pickettii TaxID=329 RepID=UPI0015FDB155|nr:hypothetical protein [Ralstonia pickettii]MBX4004307.1 hypothetical protein [Ralstonia pickettii]MBX4028164.1 hypothetical protein [Ralstonia pickettii]MBX4072743.1 hypothetical protein [Ralstonia pickettii]MBX4077700.1 hypothetical protein [Ralstonia pickettii]MBX4090705.1 hypothetical protein [Ralstonia pickettii]